MLYQLSYVISLVINGKIKGLKKVDYSKRICPHKRSLQPDRTDTCKFHYRATRHRVAPVLVVKMRSSVEAVGIPGFIYIDGYIVVILVIYKVY